MRIQSNRCGSPVSIGASAEQRRPLLAPPAIPEMSAVVADPAPFAASRPAPQPTLMASRLCPPKADFSAVPQLARAKIYAQIPTTDLLNLRQVNKFFYTDIEQPELWRDRLAGLDWEPAIEAAAKLEVASWVDGCDRELTRCCGLREGEDIECIEAIAWSTLFVCGANAASVGLAVCLGELSCLPAAACIGAATVPCLGAITIWESSNDLARRRHKYIRTMSERYEAAQRAAAQALNDLRSPTQIAPLQKLQYGRQLRDFIPYWAKLSRHNVLQRAVLSLNVPAVACAIDGLPAHVDLRQDTSTGHLATLTSWCLQAGDIGLAARLVSHGADLDAPALDGCLPRAVAQGIFDRHLSQKKWVSAERLASPPFSLAIVHVCWPEDTEPLPPDHEALVAATEAALVRTRSDREAQKLVQLLPPQGSERMKRLALAAAVEEEHDATALILHRAGAKISPGDADERVQRACRHLSARVSQAYASGSLTLASRLSRLAAQ